MDLNDELTPAERDEMRDRVTGGVKRMRAARARRSRIVAGAAASALVAVVVGGIAFAATHPRDDIATPVETVTPTPTPTPTSTPTSTPTPSETPTTDPEPQSTPTIAFGNDCSGIVSTDELSSLLGVDVTGPDHGDLTEVGTLGGLDCLWKTPDNGGLAVYVYPSSVVPDEVRAKYASVVCEDFMYDGMGCRVAIESDGTWMLVTAPGFFIDTEARAADDAEMIDRLDTVLPTLREALSRTVVPIAAEKTPAWWVPVACDDLRDRIGVDQILGTNDFVDGYPSGFGTDVHVEIARDLGLGRVCRWYAPDSEPLDAVIVTVYPGGAWNWEQLTSGWDDADRVEVDGAEAAYLRTGGIRPTSSTVLATDGVNIIEVMEAPDAVRATELAIAALRGGQ